MEIIGMPKYFYFLLLLLITACGQKKIDLTGETPIKTNDFLNVFQPINNNFYASDSNFLKLGDTSRIMRKAIIQFIPDSAITNLIGNDKRPLFYAIGKILKEKELYLLLNIQLHKRAVMAVIVLHPKTHQYLGSKILLDNGLQDEYVHSVSINKEPTFLLSREKSGKDNLLQFSRTGWVYSTDAGFMVVVNDSNESPSKSNIINPIDTLPRKNKFSGDYEQDKRNFISLRDGKNGTSYEFFIHFEKNNASCIGELKGEFKMKDANHGQYRFTGDPCVIDFRFEDREIFVKEEGTCGNHRGIKCYFDDQYTRKKEPKSGKKK